MDKETKEIIGTRIGEIRRARKITQEQMAEKLEVTSKHVSHVENGSSIYSLEKLIRFCEICGCSLDYVIFGNKKNKSLSRLPKEILELLDIGNPKDLDRLNRYLKVYIELLDKEG